MRRRGGPGADFFENKRKDHVAIPKNSKLLRFLPPGTDHREVKKCFGGLPQGNESAHALGCYECEHFRGGESDACSKASDYKYEKNRVKKASLLPVETKELYVGIYFVYTNMETGYGYWRLATPIPVHDLAALRVRLAPFKYKRIMSATVPVNNTDLEKWSKER
jgi:hypothetical protein